jgi:hypothetical protein
MALVTKTGSQEQLEPKKQRSLGQTMGSIILITYCELTGTIRKARWVLLYNESIETQWVSRWVQQSNQEIKTFQLIIRMEVRQILKFGQ